MAAGEIGKITWGTSFANTWEFGYALDRPVAYSQPREGSEFAFAPSGEEDSWVVGTDYFLSFLARWIPAATGTTPAGGAITGWDGATGVDAALAWLQAKNTGRFYPLRTSGTYKTFILKAPMEGAPTFEPDGTKQVSMVIRATDGSAFTGY